MMRVVLHPNVALIWLALALAGCSKRAAPSAHAADTHPAPPVHVSRVEELSIEPTAEGTAALEAQRDAVLRAETAGRVTALQFDRGEHVKTGQVLLRQDVGRTRVALEANRASVAHARAQLAQAERERATADRLFAQGTLASQARDNAIDAERIARAAMNAAQAQGEVTRRGLTEATLVAPFDGVIVERMVELGEYVTPGTLVARLVQTSPLRARVPLPPREALDIRAGAPAHAVAFARPDTTYSAVVLRVGDVVDPKTRKLPVEVQLEGDTQSLRPGLVARFSVQCGEPHNGLVVNENAVFERFHQSYVYVVNNGVAQRRKVSLGKSYGDRVEVTDGLHANESVVNAGIDRVVDGQSVNVVETGVAKASEP